MKTKINSFEYYVDLIKQQGLENVVEMMGIPHIDNIDECENKEFVEKMKQYKNLRIEIYDMVNLYAAQREVERITAKYAIAKEIV